MDGETTGELEKEAHDRGRDDEVEERRGVGERWEKETYLYYIQYHTT